MHVLGVPALPFLDLCHHSRKLVIFPLELLGGMPLDLFLRAKTWVESGKCFEIRKADILAASQ
jgi:hypothetical protein